MNSYEFTFITSGIDPESPGFEDRFFESGCDDATLAFVKGLLAVNFNREAETYVHAVVSAYHSVKSVGVSIERFEPDFLVSAAEISARAAITRQRISNYTQGLRSDGFPAPVARIMSESPLWDWVDVSSWLFKKDIVSREHVVAARIDRTMNKVVQSKTMLAGIEKRLGFFLLSSAELPESDEAALTA